MRSLLLLFVFCIAATASFSQPMDSTALARRDSIRMARMLESAVYPLIKGAKWGGVIPVEHPDEVPDPNMTYKLLMDVSSPPAKGKAQETSGALSEVARIMNIHIAAGVPLKNLQVVLVAHGGGLYNLLTDEEYQKKYKCANPNLLLVNELMKAGVHFTACGQAMKFLEVQKQQLLPVVNVAYSAKTVMSAYTMKGYLIMDTSD